MTVESLLSVREINNIHKVMSFNRKTGIACVGLLTSNGELMHKTCVSGKKIAKK